MFNKPSQQSEPVEKPRPQAEYKALLRNLRKQKREMLARPSRLQMIEETENMVAKVRGK